MAHLNLQLLNTKWNQLQSPLSGKKALKASALFLPARQWSQRWKTNHKTTTETNMSKPWWTFWQHLCSTCKNIRNVLRGWRCPMMEHCVFFPDMFYDALLCFGQVPNCVWMQCQCHNQQFHWLLAHKLDDNFYICQCGIPNCVKVPFHPDVLLMHYVNLDCPGLRTSLTFFFFRRKKIALSGCKQKAKWRYFHWIWGWKTWQRDPPTWTNTTEEGINSSESGDRVLASRLPGEVEPLET